MRKALAASGRALAQPCRGRVRWCSSDGDGGSSTRLPSGAVVRKEEGAPAEVTTGTEDAEGRSVWFLKKEGAGGGLMQHPLSPYGTAGAGDKGLPLSMHGASEFPDARPLEELDSDAQYWLSAGPKEASTELQKRKQEELMMTVKGKRALTTILGAEEGSISIYKEGSIIICRIMGANGCMTGGLVDQFSSLLVQIHNMTGITGVVFHLVGPMKGPVHFNPDLTFETAGSAAQATQRLSIDLVNCQPITVCAFSSELSGVALEVFAHCDFLFGHETNSTVKFGAVEKNHAGLAGGLGCLSARITAGKALMMGARPQSVDAETAAAIGLLDRAVADPLESAKKFLKSFPAEDWRIVRKMKDLITTTEIMNMQEGLIREQYHMRYCWGTAPHLESVEHTKKSI